MSSIPATTDDCNVELLRSSERIQKLTVAADALVARDFILSQKDDVLDQLEKYVSELEGEVEDAEGNTASLRARCALLRSGTRGATAGQSSEVNALWRQHGASLTRLLRMHSMRLVEIEMALATSADGDEAQPASEAALSLVDRQK